jgi:hypothetical protein
MRQLKMNVIGDPTVRAALFETVVKIWDVLMGCLHGLGGTNPYITRKVGLAARKLIEECDDQPPVAGCWMIGRGRRLRTLSNKPFNVRS